MKRKTFAAVTSQQVAQLAGVSQSAVSRTFTPGASISPATREKVLKAARELGYRPNAIARSLNTARSRIIGVVISYFDNPFYSQVLEALAQKLDTLNYHLLLFVGDREGNVDRIFDQIMQYRVDGIVLASVTLSLELSEECLAAGIPVVLFNRSEESGMASSVNSNNEAAARQIAEFLLAGSTSVLPTWAAWPIPRSISPASAGSFPRWKNMASLMCGWCTGITTLSKPPGRPIACFRRRQRRMRSLSPTIIWPSR